MAATDAVPAEGTEQPLTPEGLRRQFGARAAVTQEGVRILCAALALAPPEVLVRWRTQFGRWAGRALEKVPRHLAKLAQRYGIGSAAADSDALLFALQTYYALLVRLVAGRLLGNPDVDLLPGNPFSWCSLAPSPSVRRLLDRLAEALACHPLRAPALAADGDCDLFKPLYEDLFPRALRRQLGEYYTPDWLAGHVLDQVGYTGEPGTRLLDPACGSGTFLVLALRRLREKVESGEWIVDSERMPCNGCDSAAAADHSPLSTLHFPLSAVVGFDLNPLAVMTARANYLIAIADLLPKAGRVEVPVYLCDSILGTAAAQSGMAEFDYVVGNPPWIAWDNLAEEERQASKPLWERYGLFSLSGNEARHGGGKKDLSMLMLYAAADRHLKPGGRLGMVITQTLFQTKGAGDGFRRFQLGPDGPPLKVLRVDDMVALRPFDAANWTSTIVLEKGAVTAYPVPYFVWGEGRGTGDEGPGARGGGREKENDECRMMNDEGSDDAAIAGMERSVHSFVIHQSRDTSSAVPRPSSPAPPHSCWACPIDAARPNSPWRISAGGEGPRLRIAAGPADYTAHLGANSGGANGVYWVEVLGAAEGGVRVRNITARGKHRIETVEDVIEPDLLYPLLRWSDVRRYAAVPCGHLLLAQDPATRTGIPEAVMHERYPRTLAYLERFRGLLASRAAYRRYQQGGPFYAMYNVGPYTMAPVKVVWRRMDRRINAAVVEEWDDPRLGRRTVIPQETCVLLACDSADEAHYLCAVLNSAAVNELVRASSVAGGKSFGTPGMLEFIPLGRFRSDDPGHLKLAALSRRAHADGANCIEQTQPQIDRLATEILGSLLVETCPCSAR